MKKGCLEFIKSDLYRYSASTSLKSFIKVFFLEAGFRKMIPIRMAQSSRGGNMYSGKNIEFTFPKWTYEN